MVHLNPSYTYAVHDVLRDVGEILLTELWVSVEKGRNWRRDVEIAEELTSGRRIEEGIVEMRRCSVA